MKLIRENLDRLYETGVLSRLDIHFADFMERLAGGKSPEIFLAAALVSSYTRQGHICLDLSSVAGTQLVEENDGRGPVVCPPLAHWQNSLKGASVVGGPGEYKPLILDERSRLYLHRYWKYQERLASLLWTRSRLNQNIDFALLREGLGRLFPPAKDEEIDWQPVAAVNALIKKFSVISGGPGTGKTTTIAKILALILEQSAGKRLRIALTAPTGKAAARLQESLKGAKEKLNCRDVIKEAIPDEAKTIHRLLGSILGSPYFRYNAENPLPVDYVVVDEASMVDLALMSKLVQGLPGQAGLILLGDKDQLASVEAGAVLGDICDTGKSHRFSRRFRSDIKEITGHDIDGGDQKGNDESGIGDCIVHLQKNYRFGTDSGIGKLSQAVNSGNGDFAVSILAEGKYKDIVWKETPPLSLLSRTIREQVVGGYQGYLKARDPHEIFQLFDRFRILCALRKGPYGVVSLNVLVEQILREQRLLRPGMEWYPGRPVLITSNDYDLRLFNGDVGIAMPDPEAERDLRVFFSAPDGTLRKFHPLRLPEHETVFAMTVHKSQGSEFDKVLLILPDRESPVLTRELIYTGITRARKSVEVWGTEHIFQTAVSRRIERTSGLRDALWGT